MALTVRLSARAERALDALAKRRRQTRSDVVREALKQYTAAGGSVARDRQPYDAWSDVIGIVRTEGRDPARTTGELFGELLHRKARARRAR